MPSASAFTLATPYGEPMQSPEQIERERLYLEARIADVDERADSTTSPSARLAYLELGRLYRARLAGLSRRKATLVSPLHSVSEGDQ
jgi:hypothetical protein